MSVLFRDVVSVEKDKLDKLKQKIGWILYIRCQQPNDYQENNRAILRQIPFEIPPELRAIDCFQSLKEELGKAGSAVSICLLDGELLERAVKIVAAYVVSVCKHVKVLMDQSKTSPKEQEVVMRHLADEYSGFEMFLEKSIDPDAYQELVGGEDALYPDPKVRDLKAKALVIADLLANYQIGINQRAKHLTRAPADVSSLRSASDHLGSLVSSWRAFHRANALNGCHWRVPSVFDKTVESLIRIAKVSRKRLENLKSDQKDDDELVMGFQVTMEKLLDLSMVFEKISSFRGKALFAAVQDQEEF